MQRTPAGFLQWRLSAAHHGSSPALYSPVRYVRASLWHFKVFFLTKGCEQIEWIESLQRQWMHLRRYLNGLIITWGVFISRNFSGWWPSRAALSAWMDSGGVSLFHDSTDSTVAISSIDSTLVTAPSVLLSIDSTSAYKFWQSLNKVKDLNGWWDNNRSEML